MPQSVRKTPPKTGAERMAAYRARMKAAGLVPRTIWVPDPRDPGFVDEARRQARSAARDPHDHEIIEWLDEARDWRET